MQFESSRDSTMSGLCVSVLLQWVLCTCSASGCLVFFVTNFRFCIRVWTFDSDCFGLNVYFICFLSPTSSKYRWLIKSEEEKKKQKCILIAEILRMHWFYTCLYYSKFNKNNSMLWLQNFIYLLLCRCITNQMIYKCDHKAFHQHLVRYQIILSICTHQLIEIIALKTCFQCISSFEQNAMRDIIRGVIVTVFIP